MTTVTKKTRIHNTPQIEIKEDFIVQAPGHLIDTAIANKLTGVEWSLWMYLMRLNPFADCTSDGEPIYKDIPSPSDLAIILGRDRKTIERAAKHLEKLGLCKCPWEFQQQSKVEDEVRNRLHQQLGGLIEVTTPAGRIDLLTDSEIIEVKMVQDWKAAMGQVLAYGGFYPSHQKRIHLFGKLGNALASAESICQELNIFVTFEEHPN